MMFCSPGFRGMIFHFPIDTYQDTYYNYLIKTGEAVKISSDEVVKAIQADGWYPVRQRGSHRQFNHPTKKGSVTVPMGYKDLPTGTRNNIFKQAGL
jgi:predicted RNA binding protein YcfA (HicA-like mRNA interferase family)